MAITGAWKARHAIESGARKWGTGWNPVHAINDAQGRNIAPEAYAGGGGDHVADSGEWHDYEQDAIETTFGYEVATGIDDRPRWGLDTGMTREDADDFPHWGNYQNGLPGGSEIRSRDHGSADQTQTNQIPNETVSEGWENKVVGSVSNSRVSDPSTIFMQTSGVQRDKVRSGSQRSSSASNFVAPIPSRIVGKKVKVFSGGKRHYDMFPRQQASVIRGWWSRQAGTGYTTWLNANSQNSVEPKTRSVPAPPHTGPDVGTAPVTLATDQYGYTDEDTIPYA